MSVIANNKQKEQQENKLGKKNYMSQPNNPKEGLNINIPHHESEISASWLDEHVLDDFRW